MAQEHKKPVRKPLQSRTKTFLMLHGIVLLYSLSGVCSKTAAGYPFLSGGFIGWYAGALFLLFIYALVWQQVLKRLPLTTAFANKGVTIIWGILWGALLFGEQISLTMVIGAALVFTGIIMVVSADG